MSPTVSLHQYNRAQFITNPSDIIAFCTQTQGGVVKQNTAKNCCIGPFVDPGIAGAKIIGNTISGRNVLCPSFFGAGIVVQGARDSLIEQNIFEYIQNNKTGVGIFVNDDPATGAKAQNNVFKKNTLRFNDLDIYDNTTRTDNNYRGNSCGSAAPSIPSGLCNL